MASDKGSLAGITVLDLGQVYNGPYATFLMAMAGARVIKVESLTGEILRGRGETSPADKDIDWDVVSVSTNAASLI